MNDQAASEICRQMSELRQEVDEDVDNVVESAQTLGDWREYVRAYPWLCVGAAAVAGYLIVPTKRSTHRLNEKAIARLIAEQHPATVPPAERTGLMTSMLHLAANTAMRAALGYVGQNAGDWIGRLVAAKEDNHSLMTHASSNGE